MIPIAKPEITDAEKNAVMQVLNSGMLAQGPKVKEFEEQFEKMTGHHAIAVTNGTTALHTILTCLGIKEGDEVLTVPFTFAASANSIKMCGATPVFVDIDSNYLMDVSKIEEKITSKTKAILPVNLYGQCADYDRIQEIADKHNLVVIEDAAQSIGATYKGRVSGSLADGAAFSLYATKNIMSGEGGMVTCKDEIVSKECKQFRHHGQGERYEYVALGYNYRMTDLHAAIAVEQMKRLNEISSKRQHNAELYNELLKDVKGIVTPKVVDGNTHVYHQYAILVTDEYPLNRDELAAFLNENEVGTGIHYPKPLHLHKAFEDLGYVNGDFPMSENVAKKILSLPVHPLVFDEDIVKIVELIKNGKK
ncbi:DegT/DnrJ/EryC1/StrS family aminotransferase [Candidatus Woesearchaeota archaeon]|nr:DegT/DnrJ/EryC1/StrS family aminotransferase [Candidatus Woesearchaeota archaeon]